MISLALFGLHAFPVGGRLRISVHVRMPFAHLVFHGAYHRRGIEQLQTAARRGEERAYAVLGLLHSTGSGVPRDLDEARRIWAELKQVNPKYSFAGHLARLPFSNPADADSIKDGLAKAGLPD